MLGESPSQCLCKAAGFYESVRALTECALAHIKADIVMMCYGKDAMPTSVACNPDLSRSHTHHMSPHNGS